jgi:hypothetical protein
MNACLIADARTTRAFSSLPISAWGEEIRQGLDAWHSGAAGKLFVATIARRGIDLLAHRMGDYVAAISNSSFQTLCHGAIVSRSVAATGTPENFVVGDWHNAFIGGVGCDLASMITTPAFFDAIPNEGLEAFERSMVDRFLEGYVSCGMPIDRRAVWSCYTAMSGLLLLRLLRRVCASLSASERLAEAPSGIAGRFLTLLEHHLNRDRLVLLL